MGLRACVIFFNASADPVAIGMTASRWAAEL
jgi:hypothetical protein